MKVKIPLSVVNTYKMCPVCRTIYNDSHNYCPHESEKVELLPIEVDTTY